MAFVAAPSAPALPLIFLMLFGFGSGGPEGFAVVPFMLLGYGVLLAYGATVLVGVPAYLLLLRRRELSAGRSAVAGALVASGGAILLLGGVWLARGAQLPAWDLGALGAFLLIIALPAAPGAFGGWVFWRVLTGGRRSRS